MVPPLLSRTHATSSAGMAGDRTGSIDADPGAHRQRQDAHGVPLVHQPADVRGRARPRGRCRVLYISPLKALAVDVERNLRAPLAGIATARGCAATATSAGGRDSHRRHAGDRARALPARSADILITTPESLYLLLTSNAREALRSDRYGHHRRDPRAGGDQAGRASRTVARAARDDALMGPRHCSASASRRRSVPSTKWRASWAAPSRGTSSASSTGHPVSRSSRRSTPRREEAPRPRGSRCPSRTWHASDRSRRSRAAPRRRAPVRSTIWAAIHPRLLELISAPPSTLIFVNSRRIAERLAGAINELAGETLVRVAPWLAGAARSGSRSKIA